MPILAVLQQRWGLNRGLVWIVTIDQLCVYHVVFSTYTCCFDARTGPCSSPRCGKDCPEEFTVSPESKEGRRHLKTERLALQSYTWSGAKDRL